jgi:hypothetical protein
MTLNVVVVRRVLKPENVRRPTLDALLRLAGGDARPTRASPTLAPTLIRARLPLFPTVPAVLADKAHEAAAAVVFELQP